MGVSFLVWSGENRVSGCLGMVTIRQPETSVASFSGCLWGITRQPENRFYIIACTAA
nr:hypothetical protein [uncultured Kingella sp.]